MSVEVQAIRCGLGEAFCNLSCGVAIAYVVSGGNTPEAVAAVAAAVSSGCFGTIFEACRNGLGDQAATLCDKGKSLLFSSGATTAAAFVNTYIITQAASYCGIDIPFSKAMQGAAAGGIALATKNQIDIWNRPQDKYGMWIYFK